MTRRIEDLWPLLRIIAGPDGRDAGTRVSPDEPTPAAVEPGGLQVHVMSGVGRVRCHKVVEQAVERSATVLTARGARRFDLQDPRLREVFNIWSAMLAQGAGGSYAELLGNGKPIPVMREVLRFPLGRSNHTPPALALAVLETLQRQLPGRVQTYVDLGRALQHDLEEVLGPDGVIVAPVYPRPAPRHRASMLTPFDFVCTALFNAMEFPVTVVPVGFDDAGLPLAVQVAARRGNDYLTIATAAVIEAALGGWTRADPISDDDQNEPPVNEDRDAERS